MQPFQMEKKQGPFRHLLAASHEPIGTFSYFFPILQIGGHYKYCRCCYDLLERLAFGKAAGKTPHRVHINPDRTRSRHWE